MRCVPIALTALALAACAPRPAEPATILAPPPPTTAEPEPEPPPTSAPPTATPPPISVPSGACAKAGCSGTICADAEKAPGIVTTCEFRPEYACYQNAACERQPSGECGFSPSAELSACLKRHGAP